MVMYCNSLKLTQQISLTGESNYQYQIQETFNSNCARFYIKVVVVCKIEHPSLRNSGCLVLQVWAYTLYTVGSKINGHPEFSPLDPIMNKLCNIEWALW